jgi:hypothetical protein
MPRSKENPNEFVAGMLPIVTVNGRQYYVDGQMERLRNVNDFMDVITYFNDEVWESISEKDQAAIVYEFTGEK